MSRTRLVVLVMLAAAGAACSVATPDRIVDHYLTYVAGGLYGAAAMIWIEAVMRS